LSEIPIGDPARPGVNAGGISQLTKPKEKYSINNLFINVISANTHNARLSLHRK